MDELSPTLSPLENSLFSQDFTHELMVAAGPSSLTSSFLISDQPLGPIHNPNNYNKAISHPVAASTVQTNSHLPLATTPSSKHHRFPSVAATPLTQECSTAHLCPCLRID